MQRQILMRSFVVALAALLTLALPAATVEPGEIDTDSPLVDILMSDGMTREELVGLYRALAGGGFEPPDCVAGEEMFDDVPASSNFCPWIEELARRGITGGCDADSYCPGNPITRAQMAAFLITGLEVAKPRWARFVSTQAVDDFDETAFTEVFSADVVAPVDGVLMMWGTVAVTSDRDSPSGSTPRVLARGTIDGEVATTVQGVQLDITYGAGNDPEGSMVVVGAIPVTAGLRTVALEARLRSSSSGMAFFPGFGRSITTLFVPFGDSEALGVPAPLGEPTGRPQPSNENG